MNTLTVVIETFRKIEQRKTDIIFTWYVKAI